jgi:hypothetical protein
LPQVLQVYVFKFVFATSRLQRSSQYSLGLPRPFLSASSRPQNPQFIALQEKEKAARRRLRHFILRNAAQPYRLRSLIDFSEWHDQQRDWRFASSNGSPPLLIGLM